MKNNRKQKLIDLGAETLAYALLELAEQSETADDLIKRIIAGPDENIQRFKRKLSSLKRSKRFIDRRSSSVIARKLKMLLEDLKSGVTAPLTGVERVAAFYKADDATLRVLNGLQTMVVFYMKLL